MYPTKILVILVTAIFCNTRQINAIDDKNETATNKCDSEKKVCGKDGSTYQNICELNSKGVSLEHEGECENKPKEKNSTKSAYRPDLILKAATVKETDDTLQKKLVKHFNPTTGKWEYTVEILPTIVITPTFHHLKYAVNDNDSNLNLMEQPNPSSSSLNERGKLIKFKPMEKHENVMNNSLLKTSISNDEIVKSIPNRSMGNKNIVKGIKPDLKIPQRAINPSILLPNRHSLDAVNDRLLPTVPPMNPLILPHVAIHIDSNKLTKPHEIIPLPALMQDNNAKMTIKSVPPVQKQFWKSKLQSPKNQQPIPNQFFKSKPIQNVNKTSPTNTIATPLNTHSPTNEDGPLHPQVIPSQVPPKSRRPESLKQSKTRPGSDFVKHNISSPISSNTTPSWDREKPKQVDRPTSSEKPFSSLIPHTPSDRLPQDPSASEKPVHELIRLNKTKPFNKLKDKFISLPHPPSLSPIPHTLSDRPPQVPSTSEIPSLSPIPHTLSNRPPQVPRTSEKPSLSPIPHTLSNRPPQVPRTSEKPSLSPIPHTLSNRPPQDPSASEIPSLSPIPHTLSNRPPQVPRTSEKPSLRPIPHTLSNRPPQDPSASEKPVHELIRLNKTKPFNKLKDKFISLPHQPSLSPIPHTLSNRPPQVPRTSEKPSLSPIPQTLSNRPPQVPRTSEKPSLSPIPHTLSNKPPQVPSITKEPIQHTNIPKIGPLKSLNRSPHKAITSDTREQTPLTVPIQLEKTIKKPIHKIVKPIETDLTVNHKDRLHNKPIRKQSSKKYNKKLEPLEKDSNENNRWGTYRVRVPSNISKHYDILLNWQLIDFKPSKNSINITEGLSTKNYTWIANEDNENGVNNPELMKPIDVKADKQVTSVLWENDSDNEDNPQPINVTQSLEMSKYKLDYQNNADSDNTITDADDIKNMLERSGTYELDIPGNAAKKIKLKLDWVLANDEQPENMEIPINVEEKKLNYSYQWKMNENLNDNNLPLTNVMENELKNNRRDHHTLVHNNDHRAKHKIYDSIEKNDMKESRAPFFIDVMLTIGTDETGGPLIRSKVPGFVNTGDGISMPSWLGKHSRSNHHNLGDGPNKYPCVKKHDGADDDDDDDDDLWDVVEDLIVTPVISNN